MYNKALIIDADEASLKAAVLSGKGLLAVERFEEPVENGLKAAALALSASLRSKGYRSFSRVYLGLPASSVSMRALPLPFTDKRKIDEVLPFEAREMFLKPTDELVLTGMPLSGGMVLATAVDKTALEGYIEAFREAGLEPGWIGSSLFSKDRLLTGLHAGDAPAAFIDSVSATAVRDHRPFFYREIRDGRDMALCMAMLGDEGIRMEDCYATEKAALLLKDIVTGAKTVAIPDETAGISAMAAHVRDGLKGSIDFKTGEFARRAEEAGERRSLKTAGALLAVLTVLWGAYSYLNYSASKAALARLRSGMERSYRDLFPDEKRVADALYQLEARRRAVKETSGLVKGSSDVITVMRKLTEASMQSQRVRLYRIQVQGPRVIAGGETNSFESVNAFKDALLRLSYFKEVAVTDLKASAGGGVSFSLSASAREGL